MMKYVTYDGNKAIYKQSLTKHFETTNYDGGRAILKKDASVN